MKSILIVKLGALGDIYDTVIYLTDLSKKCDVTFVVHERFAGPLQYLCPDIRLIKLKPASPISYVPLIFDLLSGKFSKIAIFQISFKIVVFFKVLSPFSQNKSLRDFYEELDKQNVSRTNLERSIISRLTGVYPEIHTPKIHHSPPNHEIQKQTIPSRDCHILVSIGIGGGNPYDDARNRILKLDFMEEAIIKMGRVFPGKIKVLLLGNGQDDHSRAEQLLSHLEEDKNITVVSLVNKTNIGDLQYVLSKSQLFLGPDSFIAKLAGMFTPKAFVYLGPTNPNALVHDKSSAVFVTPNINIAPCAPCHSPCHGKKSLMFKCERNICMETHEVDAVLAYLLSKHPQNMHMEALQ